MKNNLQNCRPAKPKDSLRVPVVRTPHSRRKNVETPAGGPPSGAGLRLLAGEFGLLYQRAPSGPRPLERLEKSMVSPRLIHRDLKRQTRRLSRAGQTTRAAVSVHRKMDWSVTYFRRWKQASPLAGSAGLRKEGVSAPRAGCRRPCPEPTRTAR